MLVYRKDPITGFITTIQTEGNYKPEGWKKVPARIKKQSKK